MIKVSVVIPIYNAEKHLRQCIGSVVAQTLTDIEIILIDDGSADRSADICKEYLNDSRVIYYRKNNEGLAAARQDGMERSHGEYIGFVDSDDYIEPDMYEKMYTAAKSNDSDVVLCDCYKAGVEEHTHLITQGAHDVESIQKNVLPWTFIGIDNTGNRRNIRWSNCIRIYKMETVNRFNLHFLRTFRRCQDLPFTLDVMLHARNFYYLNECLYHNRQEAGSLSRGYTLNMWKLIKPLIAHIYDAVNNYTLHDYSELANSTAFFLSLDCIYNEFKDDAPGGKTRKKNIDEIIKDPTCGNCLDKFDFARLNKFYRMYYNNIRTANSRKLIFDRWYYDSWLKWKIVAPIMYILTENGLYKKLRKR